MTERRQAALTFTGLVGYTASMGADQDHAGYPTAAPSRNGGADAKQTSPWLAQSRGDVARGLRSEQVPERLFDLFVAEGCSVWLGGGPAGRKQG